MFSWRLYNAWYIPFKEKEISGMLGNPFPVLLVVVMAGILSRSSWVKTDLNWFSASALPKLSETGDPLTVIVEIVSVSFLLALMYF